MKTVFADTWYWIALLDPQDTLHPKAINVSITLTQAQIYIGQMVLTEILNHFSKRGNFLRYAAANLIESLQENPAITVILQTDNIFNKPSLSTNNVPIKHGAIPIVHRSASCNSKIF